MPQSNETSLALADLSTMSPDELAEVAEASLAQNQKQKSKIDELLGERTELAVEAVSIDWAELAGAIGGGATAGMVMGNIQYEIDAGTEGYDEESLKLLGFVDKDIAMALGATVGHYMAKKAGARAERRQPGSGQSSLKMARVLRGTAMGVASGAAYRMGYAFAAEPDDDETTETDDEGDQAAV